MLCQLSTVKTRLAINQFDLQFDAMLTSAIKGVSVRFDKETNRTLTRTANLTEEFDADDTEIRVPCYPIEAVTKFELKENETEGWVEQTSPLALLTSHLGRVTFTGGYVLPGTTPSTGQTALPDDLEQAAIEQVAAWFQNRDKLGLIRNRPDKGTYQQYAQLDLLLNVQAVLKPYERWVS
jgi:hypothetical protein